MGSADNEAVVRRFYRAYAEQDGATLVEIAADDQTLHVSGRHALSGDYRGTSEIFDYVGKVGAWTGGKGGFEVEVVLTDDGEHAAAIVTGTAVHDGKSFERRLVHLFTIREGEIVDFRDLPFDQYAEDSFWPGPERSAGATA